MRPTIQAVPLNGTELPLDSNDPRQPDENQLLLFGTDPTVRDAFGDNVESPSQTDENLVDTGMGDAHATAE